jgi:hypothetical protein
MALRRASRRTLAPVVRTGPSRRRAFPCRAIVLPVKRFAGCSAPEDGVEDGEEVAETGNDGELLRPTCGGEPGVVGADDGVPSNGAKGFHEEGVAHPDAAARDRPMAAPLAGVAVDRRYADERAMRRWPRLLSSGSSAMSVRAVMSPMPRPRSAGPTAPAGGTPPPPSLPTRGWAGARPRRRESLDKSVLPAQRFPGVREGRKT